MSRKAAEIKACTRWMAVCVDVFDHPIVGMQVPPPKPADPSRHAQSPAIAWLDLIAGAAFKPRTLNHKGKVIDLQRGQFLAGRSYWAKRWNWGEQAVRSFLSRLTQSDMIAICNQSLGHYATVATISNYDTYQNAKADSKPIEKPEANQSLTSGQPEGNQTVQRNTKDTNNNPPGESRERENEELHRRAYEAGLATKGGKTAQSARAQLRTRGELDGRNGITFQAGKLTVVNGHAADLLADFPGIDLAAVCAKAAPEIARFSYPSCDDAMAVLRRHAQIETERRQKAPGAPAAAGSKPTMMEALALRRQAREAAEATS